MSHVRLYLPAIVLMLGAAAAIVFNGPELSIVGFVLLIWAVSVHLREAVRCHGRRS